MGKGILKRSRLVVILLFLISLIFSLGIAQIAISTPAPLTLIQQAQQHYQAAQFPQAIQEWQQAADAFAEQGDRLNQAMALGNLALSHQSLGQWNEANHAIAASLNLLQSQPTTPDRQRILASTLDIQGQGQLALGQPTQALETWQEATVIYQTLNNPEAVSRSQINQAQALQALGLYPRACTTLLKTLSLASVGDSPQQSRLDCTLSPLDLQTLTSPQSVPLQILVLRSLGNVLRIMGKGELSQLVLVKSWQLAHTLEGDRDLAEIYLSLGNTARALGDRQWASNPQPANPATISEDCIPRENPAPNPNFYQQALACYRQAQLSPAPLTQIQAQLNHLSLGIQTRQWQDIPVLLAKIQAELPTLTPSDTAVNAQLKYVQTATCLRAALDLTSTQLHSPIVQRCRGRALGNRASLATHPLPSSLSIPSWQELGQMAAIAYQQAQTLDNPEAQANALGYLASTYQQQGDWARSQQLTEQALQLLSAVNTSDLRYLWQWQLGQLYQNQGNIKSAIAAYTLAFDTLQSLRQDLVSVNPDLQFSFRDGVEPVYRELVDLLLQAENPSQDHLKQARNVIESLQIAELNNFFQEACLEAKPQAINRLDPQAAIFYSIVLPKRLAVILSLPGQPLRYYAAPVESAIVEQTFDDLFANLNPFFSSPQPRKSYQQFYDWLLRPARAQLAEQGIQTLVFVSDGVLRNIPFAALFDGQHYLVEQYNLALTPSLQLLGPRAIPLENRHTLAGGLAQSRQGFPSLPGVKQEVTGISAIVPTEVLLDQGFTRDRLKQSIKTNSFPIVHLATHGQFSSQAEKTFLLTWDEQINVKDLDQLLQDPNPIELLILSACQTAVGDRRATLGLAGFAVRARARSTIATLWGIQDQSTAELMAEFYRAFKQPGVTRAAALRQAQLLLLKNPQYQHPYYWAAFVLVGSWL